ncbi:hypothetical protein DID78_01275 [Candidatus Marinamargulisbacteria bacterium SCGC AG-343-D04]|nr:hypothetical protein DID78_01275 [Candidatus Marinamargulisbacteria bacterium SCGC AG-343-D04]
MALIIHKESKKKASSKEDTWKLTENIKPITKCTQDLKHLPINAESFSNQPKLLIKPRILDHWIKASSLPLVS